MKKIILILTTLVMAVTANAQKATIESLREAELNRFKVMIAQDEKGLDAVMHADLVYNHSNAVTDNKVSYVGSIVSKKTIYASIESEELTPRVYGKFGIITGTAKIKNQAKDGSFTFNHLKYTDVWIFQDKRWQMLSWQSTKILN
jgi:hypothetical protein